MSKFQASERSELEGNFKPRKVTYIDAQARTYASAVHQGSTASKRATGTLCRNGKSMPKFQASERSELEGNFKPRKVRYPL